MNNFCLGKICLHAFCTLLILFLLITPSSGVEKISLNSYPILSLPVPNPMDLTVLPSKKTFQVTNSHFILQFFFAGGEIYGIIFKRDKDYSIHMRWCFFRSCEESSYDYTSVIAPAHKPPFDQGFFSAKLPPQIKYRFQGLEFRAVK